MKNLNPSTENCRRNGVIGLGLMADQLHNTMGSMADQLPTAIKIKVSYGFSQFEVPVPSNSSFGYLKSVICQKFHLKPEIHKLFFRGQEREDDENLRKAGVEDNSEVLFVEDKICEQKIHEESQETCVISKGEEAVAEVRKEVDNLEQQVSALQGVVNSGTKVDEKEIIFLTELLMRQLLKLDGIEAEGEGKVQRKTEVRRVQSIVEKLDILKSRNSNASSTSSRTVSVTTRSEASNPGCQNVNASSPKPSSAPSHVPYFPHPTIPSSSFSPLPYYAPSLMPYYNPFIMPFPILSAPSSDPFSMASSAPSPMPYFAPPFVPSSPSLPVPYFAPSPYFNNSNVPSPVPSSMPSPQPFSMPSSYKINQN